MTTNSPDATPVLNPESKPKRIFVYEGRDFPDPDPSITVEEVRHHFTDFFPELANADTSEAKRGQDTVYTFSKRVGNKGAIRG